MIEIKSFPNNQDEYVGAEYAMRWLHGRTSGVFGANGNGSITVIPGTMSCELSDSIGWLADINKNGIVWWNDNEKQTGEKLRVDVDMADGLYTRIDRFVVSWETINYVPLPTFSVLKGTPSSNPEPPALTNDEFMRQISLARVTLPPGVTELTQAMITDERLDPEVCGIVTESVEIDTTLMQSQFDALLVSIQQQLEHIISDALPYHNITHAANGSDPLTPDMIGAAKKSETVAATLASGSWTGTEAPYSYTLNINGITADSNQEILPAISITGEQLDALQRANLVDGGQGTGYTTILAFGEVPEINIPIRVILRGDA